jgi:hypothetical protein
VDAVRGAPQRAQDPCDARVPAHPALPRRHSIAGGLVAPVVRDGHVGLRRDDLHCPAHRPELRRRGAPARMRANDPRAEPRMARAFRGDAHCAADGPLRGPGRRPVRDGRAHRGVARSRRGRVPRPDAGAARDVVPARSTRRARRRRRLACARRFCSR